MRWILGDIHGMLKPLRTLVDAIDHIDAAAKFYFVGDYVGLDANGSLFRPFFVQANSGNTTNDCRALTATTAQRPAGWGGSVFVIVMENHNHDQVVRSPFAPYINGTLLKMGADAAGYHPR